MSSERSARLETVGVSVSVSVTRTPPTVRSMTLTDVAGRQTLPQQSAPDRQESARVEQAWRMLMLAEYRLRLFGLGKTGRPVWPPPRRWVCASAHEGAGRAGCGRSPRRGAWGGCMQTWECIGSADDIVNRSDRRPLSPLWSQSRRARRLKKSRNRSQS